MSDQELALRALKEVNFDSATHLKSVWQDFEYDVDSLHGDVRRRIREELDRLEGSKTSRDPLGMVLHGTGGTGKTHLLSAIRKYAFSKKIGFILVDMTAVENFEKTVAKGYVDSLQEDEADGTPQFKGLIECLINLTGSPVSTEELAQQESVPTLNKQIQAILAALVRTERQATVKFRDVIRALLLLNSNNLDIQGVGYNWLRGFGIDEKEKEAFGFSRALTDSLSIIEGLSWLMNLRSPSVLALDQLDPVVAQYHTVADINASDLSEEQNAAKSIAKSIIEGIGNGLSALRDRTAKTLILVSCMYDTWSILEKQAISTVQGRFQEPIALSSVLNKSTAEQIVELRLREAYNKVNFSPPYPTWPFSPAFFSSAVR
jgi:hypothetical protein